MNTTEPHGFAAAIARHHAPSAEPEKTETRTIRAIAHEIRRDWRKPYFAAAPYLDAMTQLETVTDAYGHDDARDIIRYFLGNASSYRGDTAKRIKAELKAML